MITGEHMVDARRKCHAWGCIHSVWRIVPALMRGHSCAFRQSNEHDWVVRFNYMENLLERERADLWVGRTDLLTHSFWQRTEGFYPSQAPLAMAAAKEILLLGTGTSLTPVVSQVLRSRGRSRWLSILYGTRRVLQ